MDFKLERLRPGEVIAGASALLLVVFMFALPWYGTKLPLGRTAAILVTVTSFNGWHSLSDLRWLMLVTIVAAFALFIFQATRRAPAVPVTFSVIVTVLALFTVLGLIYRVLINVPGPNDLVDQKLGAYLGLVSAIGILWGGFASMRREGILEQDGPPEIPTVRLSSLARSA
jgi:hypothetical protein